MLRGIGRLRSGGSGFNPASLFSASEKGVWYDQSDISTGFQDSSGATAQSASGQPTGLRTDKSRSYALGSEVITNAADRTGSSDTGYWSKNIGVTISSGFVWTAAANTSALFSATKLTTRIYYEVTWTISSMSSGGLRLYAGGNTGVVRSTPGTYTERILCGTVDTTIGLQCSGVTTATVTSQSWKPVGGVHMSQGTSAARPTYTVSASIYGDVFDAVDDQYIGPTLAAGTFTADMDCFIAMRRSASLVSVYPSAGGGTFVGYMSPNAVSAQAGAGSNTSYAVDGVAVAGGTSVQSNTLNTAFPSDNSWHILEIKNLDLSAWTGLGFGRYDAGTAINGGIAGVVLCQAQTSEMRAKIRRFLGSRVGLSL